MNTNRDKTINKARQAIAGIEKHFSSMPTLVLDGTPTTPKDVIATLQAAITAIDVAEAASKTFHDVTAAQHAAIAKGNAFLKALKMLVRNQLGSAEAVLGDFGFDNPKTTAPTAGTKAEAVQKRVATRKARSTVGPKAKAKIKGQVPATAPTPVKPS